MVRGEKSHRLRQPQATRVEPREGISLSHDISNPQILALFYKQSSAWFTHTDREISLTPPKFPTERVLVCA